MFDQNFFNLEQEQNEEKKSIYQQDEKKEVNILLILQIFRSILIFCSLVKS